MELKKLFVAMTAVSTLALTACGSDSDDNSSDNGNNSSAVACTVGTGTVAEDTYVLDGQELPICDLKGVIAADAKLTTDYVYRLNGYVKVGNGSEELTAASQVKNVTLTIDEGVQFRSSGRGSLIITRGSKIAANGTAAHPIVMASQDYDLDDNDKDLFEGQGEWGGLVLQGYAKNNNCPEDSEAAICNVADEADTGFHGGNKDDDNSGVIKHLIVAEGGFEIAPDSEVNGITMHSVGYGTTVEDVMIYNNSDDGIEFFGGAVNVKNLILVDNGDESIDWDDGYRGNIQFALVRQGLVAKGDNAIEADNAGKSNTAIPVSNPTLANITFQTGAAGSSYLMRAKLGTQGTLVNIAADNYKDGIRVADEETLVTLENVLVEFSDFGKATKFDPISKDDPTPTASNDNLVGWSSNSTSAFVELGDAFQVTGSEATLATPATFTSANGSDGFFNAAAGSYIGAVDPTVTAAASAWWAWAAAVVPAAFE